MGENYKLQIPALKAGSILNNRFRIIESLDDTELCKNYLGRDIKNNNYVVIKELIDTFEDQAKREQAAKQFKNEASILITLVHPAIPTFRDYFEFKNRRYIIMDYVQGKNLFDLIKTSDKFFEETLILKWASELCDVLHYLHTRQPSPVIFRALSPHNIILSKEGRLKLIDFGISKKFNPKAKTMAVVKMGTPHFSPMEQYAGLTDARSDIYSLGATLYYVITKTLPVDAIERSMNDVPLPSCREINSKISSDLETIISRAMALDKEKRYQTMQEMRNSLRNISKFGKRGMPSRGKVTPSLTPPASSYKRTGSAWGQTPAAPSSSSARPPLKTKRLTLPGMPSGGAGPKSGERPPLKTKRLSLPGLSQSGKQDSSEDKSWQRPPLKTKRLSLGDISSSSLKNINQKSSEKDTGAVRDSRRPDFPSSSASSRSGPPSVSAGRESTISSGSSGFKSDRGLSFQKSSPGSSQSTGKPSRSGIHDKPSSSWQRTEPSADSTPKKDAFPPPAPPPRRSSILEPRRKSPLPPSPGRRGNLLEPRRGRDASTKPLSFKSDAIPEPARKSSDSLRRISSTGRTHFTSPGSSGSLHRVSSPGSGVKETPVKDESAGRISPAGNKDSFPFQPSSEAEAPSEKVEEIKDFAFDDDMGAPLMGTDEPLAAGTVVNNKYRILELGDTDQTTRSYKALDMEDKCNVALKELLEQFDDPVKRRETIMQFQVEAKILIRLEHPSIPKFKEYFSYNGRRYFVIEFVDGDSLEEIARKSPLLYEEKHLLDWSIQLCDIVEYMHSQTPDPVIYRDMSPKNVILTSEGKIKITDFGISKIFTPDTKTMASAKIVNPHYSPIEQYAAQTDERTDIYSIGATLYYLITKTVPVDAIDRSISNIKLKPCRIFNKNISADFEDVIQKAMEVQKEDRYQKINQMKSDLMRLYRRFEKVSPVPEIKEAPVPPQSAVLKGKKTIEPPPVKIEREPETFEEKEEFLEEEEEQGSKLATTIISMIVIIVLLAALFGGLYAAPIYSASIQKFIAPLVEQFSNSPWLDKLASLLGN